jgi:hypothetical protein
MPDKRIDLLNILNLEGKLSKVLLYPAIETVDDPYEKTSTKGFLNPITAKCYVTQLSFESLKWKYPGTVPSGSVKVIADKKYETLFQTADKIKIAENFYKTLKDDARGYMIMRRDDYIVVILGLKND